MILIKPSFEILRCPNTLELLEYAGRLCYKTENKVNVNTTKFLKSRIQEGHESLIEHLSISVKFICDRGISHELIRHRIASYSQESTRYCNYSGGVTFIIPPWIDLKPGNYTSHIDDSSLISTKRWYYTLWNAESDYIQLLREGWTPQQARSILPNSLKTEIIMSANMREWRHVLKLRCSKKAHPQMVELMLPLLKELNFKFPVIFSDIMEIYNE